MGNYFLLNSLNALLQHANATFGMRMRHALLWGYQMTYSVILVILNNIAKIITLIELITKSQSADVMHSALQR